MEQLKYLSVSELYPHKDNPRKDLGDLTELSDSIKANGIYQNLTVVPGHTLTPDEWKELSALYKKNPTEEVRAQMNSRVSADGYTVIIGHRRLAAAKQAGLETVPCVITEMTEKEQLQTMLMENMQRSDLTIYEQAQGFQMMLNLGSSIEDIAEASGFSQTTVRRRVKLLDLDKDKFKKATERGATLFDFMELDKIESPERKNEVLATIGTKNFQQKLQTAIDEEKREKFMTEVIAAVSAHAEKVERGDNTMSYVKNIGVWNMSKGIDLPDDFQTAKYYYAVSGSGNDVYLYRDKADDPVDPEAEARKAAADAERERYEALTEQFTVVTARHFRLRKAFVKDFGAAKKNIGIISKYAAVALMVRDGYRSSNVDYETLAELLDIDVGEDDDIDIKTISGMFGNRPEYALLSTVFCELDDSSNGYWDRHWNYDSHKYEIVYAANDDLDTIYDFLKELGYEASDEEVQMMNGSHPLFADGGNA